MLKYFILGVLSIFVMGNSFAERADRDKPMQIEADKASYNDLTQTNEFIGNVVITKGTLVIRGNRVVVVKTPEGYQLATAYGKPATYRQKRDGDTDEYVEGEGLELYYDGKADTARFVKNAMVRRLQGTTMIDEVRGDVVRYDARTEMYSAENGTSGSNTKSGRVTVVIQPNSKQKTNTPSTQPKTDSKPTLKSDVSLPKNK